AVPVVTWIVAGSTLMRAVPGLATDEAIGVTAPLLPGAPEAGGGVIGGAEPAGTGTGAPGATRAGGVAGPASLDSLASVSVSEAPGPPTGWKVSVAMIASPGGMVPLPGNRNVARFVSVPVWLALSIAAWGLAFEPSSTVPNRKRPLAKGWPGFIP